MDQNIESGYTAEEQQVKVARSKKMLVYVGIFSIVMLFAGFTSAYIVSMSDGFWVNIELPNAFWWSTAYMLTSSLTIYAALVAAKKSNVKAVKLLISLTLVLGLLFAKSQFDGWGQLMELGHYATGSVDNVNGDYGKDFTFMYAGEELIFENDNYYLTSDTQRELPLKDKIEQSKNTSSSFLYILTVLHLAHLIGGLLYVISLLISSLKNKFDKDNHLKLQLGGIYWHFLDGLWLFLLLFLQFIH
ncbi:MAG: cytochrome c oxidase subunit 3 [Flavobacteriales bacterium]|jgi:cytochrome c oxidase subunit 3